ncbi:MAG TPA: type II secretion system F family protein [Verrucomicrobiae bacterium]|nr:type II secretion system F family protein [Verrucomicrobiae bacterium]
MKYDEFAFFNQQLAAMLRDGIPLEGALRRLCAEMHRGQMRDELQALEADLAKGTPMAEALAARRLPELYKRMVLVGVKSGDLPGALTMLADYFQRQSNLWARLKGLMVYPLMVLSIAFLLSCFLSFILGAFIWNNLQSLVGRPTLPAVSAGLWMSPVFIGLALVAILVGIVLSPARRMLRWRLPAFREASLAQVASAMWLMLKNGVPLDDALALVAELEKGTSAEGEIGQWRRRLASGQGKFSEMAAVGKTFPPLFTWTIAQSGEDLTAGFRHAAELFHSRALYRSELLLYSALPCSILALAAMIMSQIQPVFGALVAFLNALGGSGD